MRRLRRYLLRLLPPMLFCMAIAGPAQAQTAQRYPTLGEAYHCVDGYAQRWLEQMPSELIVKRAAGGAPEHGFTSKVSRGVGPEYFLWMPMWREYSIADVIYNAQVWVYTWIFEGSIRCSKQGQKIRVSKGPSIFNTDWLG